MAGHLIPGLRFHLLFGFAMGCQSAEEIVADTGDTFHVEHTDTGSDIADLDSSLLPAAESPCRDPELFQVKRIVDGDTVVVLGGWGEENVRLIGIDANEIGYDNEESECWAEEAKEFLEEELVDTKVWLTFDVECEDDYERTLAYVHTGISSQDFVQRVLLQGGYVSTFTVEPNSTFSETFLADEGQAMKGEVGMWGACQR